MKVLVLAYDFPPLISAGAYRPYSWYKYFAENNVYVTIVTRDWPSGSSQSPAPVLSEMSAAETGGENFRRLIKAGYMPNVRDKLASKVGTEKWVLLRKLLSYIYIYLEYLFFFCDARSPIYNEADELLRVEKFDYIIATGPPFLLFKYASLLSAKHQTHWIADYRDGWTINQGGHRNSFSDKMLNSFCKILEKKYVKNVLFVSTVAPPVKKHLAKIFTEKNIEIVYNGYFEEYYAAAYEKDAVNNKFTVVYAGTIYVFQKIFTFLEGVKKMLNQNQGAELEIVFYGLNEDFKSKIETYDEKVSRCVVFENKIPVTQLAIKLRNANLLLLLSGPTVDTGASKIFDYLAAKRKIVLVENDLSILRDILAQCKAGESLNNADEVCAFMTQEYASFLSRGRKNTEVQSVNTGFYSRRNQAKIFVDLLGKYTA